MLKESIFETQKGFFHGYLFKLFTKMFGDRYMGHKYPLIVNYAPTQYLLFHDFELQENMTITHLFLFYKCEKIYIHIGENSISIFTLPSYPIMSKQKNGE